MSTAKKAQFKAAFQTLAAHNTLIFYLWEQQNLNPLIPEQQAVLWESGLLDDPIHQEVLQQLIAALPNVIAAIYCPTPIAREMKQGVPFTLALAEKYSYAYIKVNHQQEWFLKGVRLDHKIKKFLQENLFYEACLKRYYVEYQVEQRMDKCYLDCETTPMVAKQIEAKSDHLEVCLNNGKVDQVSPPAFQMDDQELLYCHTSHHGEILLADNPRFFILKQLSEDGTMIPIGETVYSLSVKPP